MKTLYTFWINGYLWSVSRKARYIVWPGSTYILKSKSIELVCSFQPANQLYFFHQLTILLLSFKNQQNLNL